MLSQCVCFALLLVCISILIFMKVCVFVLIFIFVTVSLYHPIKPLFLCIQSICPQLQVIMKLANIIFFPLLSLSSSIKNKVIVCYSQLISMTYLLSLFYFPRTLFILHCYQYYIYTVRSQSIEILSSIFIPISSQSQFYGQMYLRLIKDFVLKLHVIILKGCLELIFIDSLEGHVGTILSEVLHVYNCL